MKVKMFTSPTCGPCKIIKPFIRDMAEDNKFELQIIELDDTNRNLFDEAGIRAVPVVIALDDTEKEIGRFQGAVSLVVAFDHLKTWGLIK